MLRIKSFAIKGGLIAAISFSAVLSHAVVVFNENFEGLSATYPGLSTYVYLTTGQTFNAATNWTVLGNAGGTSGIDIVGSSYAANYFGSYAIDLAGSPGPGGITANFSGLGTGDFRLKFFLNATGQLNNLSTFQLKIGSNTYNETNLTSVGGGYYTFDFTGNLGAVEFWSTSTNNGNLFFDNLSIEAVPEPFTMALGAAGLGLALKRRIRKSAKA